MSSKQIFECAGILGTGLIGGSIGCALKKFKLAKRVVGVSRRQSSLDLAVKKRSIDAGSRDPAILKGADLLILATPVETVISQAPGLASLLKPGCIVMDVGSTKGEVVAGLSRSFKRFVGTHPLAGSEKRGVAHADPGLFRGCLCILTPGRSSDGKAVAAVEGLYRRLGARTVRMKPSDHDAVLALTSHLPHFLAFALMLSLPERFSAFVPSSFRDMTRVAASDPGLWKDIFFTNSRQLLSWLKKFDQKSAAIRTALRRRDSRMLLQLLSRASQARKKLL